MSHKKNRRTPQVKPEVISKKVSTEPLESDPDDITNDMDFLTVRDFAAIIWQRNVADNQMLNKMIVEQFGDKKRR